MMSITGIMIMVVLKTTSMTMMTIMMMIFTEKVWKTSLNADRQRTPS